jgi:hypothetical protein
MPRKNKHNANRHEAVVGGAVCRFDSMAEHRYAEWLQRTGHRWWHHPEPVSVLVRQRPVFTMAIDFRVETAPGISEWHEVKGMATAAWRLKRKVLEAAMPRIRYVVIDAGRGVCATGEGLPVLFDDRPRKKRRAKT